MKILGPRSVVLLGVKGWKGDGISRVSSLSLEQLYLRAMFYVILSYLIRAKREETFFRLHNALISLS